MIPRNVLLKELDMLKNIARVGRETARFDDDADYWHGYEVAISTVLVLLSDEEGNDERNKMHS